MQQTSKYQFNLVEGSDDFSPTPLNQNMEKVEELLSELSTAWSPTNPAWELGSANVSEGAVDTVIHTFAFTPSVVIAWAGSYHLGATDGTTTLTLHGTASNGGRCYLNLSGAQLTLTHFYNGPYKIFLLALR